MGDLNTCPPEQFLDALNRCSLTDKRELLETLARQPNERGIRILMEILQGDSWYLRDAAADVLTRMGDKAVPALEILLYSGLWFSRAEAARVLGRIGHVESLPRMVHMLADSNQTVQSACLASIAELVRNGWAKETTRLFWNEGARRAEELCRLLMAVHPDAGRMVAELLSDPSSFLTEEPAEEREEEAPAADRKKA